MIIWIIDGEKRLDIKIFLLIEHRIIPKHSNHEGIHSEMCSSCTRMTIFKTNKSANADFPEQRRNEAFADFWVLENRTADENKHLRMNNFMVEA